MNIQVGIRREDKNVWERRVPIIPAHVTDLSHEAGLEFYVQPSPIRAIPAAAYQQAGAQISEDVAACPVVFAVKEIPNDFLRPRHTYIYFAHVIKGQAYNMPMLQRLLDLECTLIDYEKVTDDQGRRLIFFGRYAGLAGMIDSLWALGQRLAWEGYETPFSQILPTHRYADLQAAKQTVTRVGEQIAAKGLPADLTPLVCGFAGYGNVGRGAQEIYDLLPIAEIGPEELLARDPASFAPNQLVKVVFKEEHTVKPRNPAEPFVLSDYFQHPEKYESQFERFVPRLTLLINAIYWTPASPRLVTKAYLADLFRREARPRLRVIGDISCDVEGGIEATVRATEPDEPIFVYEPLTGASPNGVAGHGPVIMAVDNLPCELPVESSADFSATLRDFVPAIVTADYDVPFEDLALPSEIKRAVIAHRGELAPAYRYLQAHLNKG